MQDGRGSSVKKGKGNSLKGNQYKFGQAVGKTVMKAVPPKKAAPAKRSVSLTPKKNMAQINKRTSGGMTGPQKIMTQAKKRNAYTRSAIKQAGK